MVTGAGSGLGKAVASRLSKASYFLALVGRTAGTLKDTQAQLDRPEQALVHVCDVRRELEVTGLFERVVKTYGRLDLLFNNAGIPGPKQAVETISSADWRETLDVNVTGSFLCAREAFRIMREQRPQGGRIINNGSLAAQVPRPHGAAYSASKHAVNGLTKSLALEGRQYSIACGQIDVGNAKTSMSEGSATGALQPDGSIRPEPTFSVEDVASAVAFMAGLPLESNVLTLTILATGMPFAGRG